MPYCPNCGNMVNIGDRFCASCGSVLQATPVSGAARSDYRIVLVSRGTCSRAVAIDMLSDLLGYSDPDAARIIDNAPMEAALGLTAIQAQYISQAITEYGMQVAIFNNDGYVDMGSRATSSVYNSDGSFLSAVADVLFGLTVGNRVSTFNRWTRPTPVLFRPSYMRVSPLGTLPPLPVYRRRRPAPRPMPIPTLRPGMVPPRRPVPAPAPQSTVAGSRPMPVHPAPVPNPGPVVPPRPVGPATPPNPPFPPTGPGGAGRNGRGGPGGPGGMPGPGGGRRGV